MTVSGSRGVPGSRRELDSGAKPRKLWPSSESGPSSESRGHVRLEIGGTGSLSTRKSLEGINSMMQQRHPRRDATPNRREDYPNGPPGHHAPPSSHHHPPASYRSDIATPIKSSVHHPYQQRHTPSSGRHHPYHPGSASKPIYPMSSQKADYPGSAQKPGYGPPPRAIPPSSGKENKRKTPQSKRSLCNCKKSKCLKLYCECFAAERFCSGCNCADCGNTPTAGVIREKAIKDTRAKNPNAFKPRIGAKGVVQVQGTSPHNGHNMGCKCKRSECLKKYCEVSIRPTVFRLLCNICVHRANFSSYSVSKLVSFAEASASATIASIMLVLKHLSINVGRLRINVALTLQCVLQMRLGKDVLPDRRGPHLHRRDVHPLLLLRLVACRRLIT